MATAKRAASAATGAVRDTAEGAGRTARNTASAAGSTVGLGQGVDRLKEEALTYLGARAQHALTGVGERLGEMTERLNDPGSSGSVLLNAGKGLLEGKSPGKAVAGAAGGGLKGKVAGMFRKLTGGMRSGGPKVINIVEDIDVGVPVREAYDQWTQYQEFGDFTKGVQSVDQADEVTTNWKGKIWWSNRSWQGKVTEQIPDRRIVWTSDGAKGTNKGVVTFHPMGEDLTKILLIVEYYPKGFFEKTANIWRAQGRRLRLDLKHFRRFVMMRGEATDGWRGEIRDGEVVVDHDEAVEREEERNGEPVEPDEDQYAEDELEDEEAPPEDEPSEEYEDEPEPETATRR